MIEQATELSQVANVREQFAKRGFNFTDGKMVDKPRCFGIAKGCTLELVGEAVIEQATMVAMMAPDAQEIARLNGFRLAALMALLAGQQGAEWIGWAMKTIQTNNGTRITINDTLGAWKLRLIVNRRKSSLTLQAKAALP
jgi:hypothetical protein